LSADGIEGEQGAKEASERKKNHYGYRTWPAHRLLPVEDFAENELQDVELIVDS